ncbi:hypothetical protein OMCYN_01748 [cyanobiont of Ornithocercus magnificus]|nr:hypothetical protein OMCYN_01748 [cyanobiont of Ornithocercus magnificus]
MCQVVSATRGHSNTLPLKRWLGSGAKPSQGKGSDAFERDFSGSQIPDIDTPPGRVLKRSLPNFLYRSGALVDR